MTDSGFSRPALPTLIANIRSDLLTRMGEDVVLRRLDAEVYARVMAAAVHTLYGYIDYLARNMLPDQADEEWLTRHANMKRCPRKTAAAAAGWVRWSNITQTATIPVGTVITRDDQQEFIVTSAVTLSPDGPFLVPVVATAPGAAGNTDDGATMLLSEPISGLPSAGAAYLIAGGADAETVESWRARIIARWYQTPQGGADHDYVAWALSVSGVARAWTQRHRFGPGSVCVLIATDDPDNPAPGAATREAVHEYILPLAPVAGSQLVVASVGVKTIDMSISLAKDTAAIRAAVTAELKSFLLRDIEPGGKIYLSRMSEAISAAAGEAAHRIMSPAQDIELPDSELPVLGSVSWISYTGGN